jgi:hypothetical protein
MSAFPVSYRVVGEYDYMLDVRVDHDGGYVVNTGDHTSHEPRSGTLGQAQRERLAGALESLGASRDLPAPEGADGFMATLTVGSGADARVFHFWEGALEEDTALRAAVRELDLI